MKKVICVYEDSSYTIAQVYELNNEFYCIAFQTNESCIHFDEKCKNRNAAMQRLALFVADEYQDNEDE